MNINPRRPLFYRKQGPNIYRLFFLVVMILGGVWFIRKMEQGEVKPLFLPTPIPTRIAESYVMEGDAQFTAGGMDAAILAYQEALQVDPNNAEVWAKLARIQTRPCPWGEYRPSMGDNPGSGLGGHLVLVVGGPRR